MSKCNKCNRESQGYRLCGNCKKEWRAIRMKACEMTRNELGEKTYENRKEFDKRLKQIERGLI